MAVYEDLLGPTLVVPALVGVVWTNLARARPARAALVLVSTVSDQMVQALVCQTSDCLNSRKKGRVGVRAVGLLAPSIGLPAPALTAVFAVVKFVLGAEMVVEMALPVIERWLCRNRGDYS